MSQEDKSSLNKMKDNVMDTIKDKVGLNTKQSDPPHQPEKNEVDNSQIGAYPTKNTMPVDKINKASIKKVSGIKQEAKPKGAEENDINYRQDYSQTVKDRFMNVMESNLGSEEILDLNNSY